MRQTMSDKALNGDFFQTFSIDEGNVIKVFVTVKSQRKLCAPASIFSHRPLFINCFSRLFHQ